MSIPTNTYQSGGYLPSDHSSLNLGSSSIQPIQYIPYYKTMTDNRFFTNGRCGCICGPSDDTPANACVWCLMIIPAIAFGIFVGPKLFNISVLLPIAFGCIFLITITLLCLTQCTDPGIIPKQPHPKNFRTPQFNLPLEHAYASQSPPPASFNPSLNNYPNTNPTTQQQYPNSASAHHSPRQQSTSLHQAPSTSQPPSPHPPSHRDLDSITSLGSTDTADFSNHPNPSPYPSPTPSPRSQSLSPAPGLGSLDSPRTPRNDIFLPAPPPHLQLKPMLPSKVTLNIKGDMLTFKYCPTCHIYRPPETSHCSSCNTCTKEADHHCPFVGNCVSQRNYCFFLSFNCSVLVYMVLMLVASGIFLTAAHNDSKINQDLLRYISIGAISVIGIIGLILVGVLCGFHFFLNCCRGQQTTRGLLSKRKQGKNSSSVHHAGGDNGGIETTIAEQVSDNESSHHLSLEHDDGTRNVVPQYVQDDLDACTSPDQCHNNNNNQKPIPRKGDIPLAPSRHNQTPQITLVLTTTIPCNTVFCTVIINKGPQLAPIALRNNSINMLALKHILINTNTNKHSLNTCNKNQKDIQ